jgi:capsular polysaccharide transport system permease protein
MHYFQRINKVFLGTVVLPTLFAVIYFAIVASDIFICESRFVVRSQERQSSTPILGFILDGAGFTSSQDDAYTVRDYILSRDALRSLDHELQLKEAYSHPTIDFIRRFPGPLDWDASFENFYHYYQKVTNAQLDPASSITTLTTRAYTPELSWQMNNRLLELAEELVNKLNERGRMDLIHFSLKEVAEAEKKAKAAALSLAHYRNEKNVIDPEKQSAIPLQQVAKLQEELIATKSQILPLERLADDNPLLPVLRQHARLLEDEIQAETQRIAGGGDRSLAGKAAEYQRLILEKEFADKMLASAMSTLEQARNEAQRQQLYLERIAQPNKPDAAMEPRRLRAIIAVFALGMITWGVMSMLIAGIREHQD